MEQLTIKHLGRRLHTNLFCQWNDERNKDFTPIIGGLIEVKSKGVVAIKRNDDEYECMAYECKPILRDLSDLTKEITHNGEKFIPIVELLKIVDKDYYEEHLNSRYSEIECKAYPNYIDAYFKYMATKSLRIWVNDLYNERFWVIEKLLEWHFALDEPEGSWIDVNTLPKNPYE